MAPQHELIYANNLYLLDTILYPWNIQYFTIDLIRFFNVHVLMHTFTRIRPTLPMRCCFQLAMIYITFLLAPSYAEANNRLEVVRGSLQSQFIEQSNHNPYMKSRLAARAPCWMNL